MIKRKEQIIKSTSGIEKSETESEIIKREEQFLKYQSGIERRE
jgi:hypothetical protein